MGMTFSIEPAYTVCDELLRKLTKASVSPKNQWFFLDGSFSNLQTKLQSTDTWYYENFVVIVDKEIVAYFEAEWARPLDIIHNFRMILLNEEKTVSATKAFFAFLDYLFISRGCDVFTWGVAVKNTHALKLYERFTQKNCGHKVGIRTRSMKSYCGEISDSAMYEITKEEYFKWKNLFVESDNLHGTKILRQAT